MKRLAEKIEKRIEKKGEVKVTRHSVHIFIGVLFIFSLTSCEKAWHGRDGRAGDAYIALQWYEAEPTYVDAGTSAIPQVFYWEEYYRINPGFYQLYYEGRIWAGNGFATYAWEVTYEIWEVAGERGDWYYNGEDGPDNFFTIECNPYGPYVGNAYKQVDLEEKWEVLEKSESKLIILKKSDGLQMKVTYDKISPKNIAAEE